MGGVRSWRKRFDVVYSGTRVGQSVLTPFLEALGSLNSGPPGGLGPPASSSLELLPMSPPTPATASAGGRRPRFLWIGADVNASTAPSYRRKMQLMAMSRVAFVHSLVVVQGGTLQDLQT